MTNRSRKVGLLAQIVLVFLALPLANACGSAPAVSPTAAPPAPVASLAQPAAAPPGAEIVIGAASDLTGPFSASGVAQTAGRNAYIRYVNEKLGGINGVKINLVTVDTAFDENREVAAYKRFRDVDRALLMNNLSSGAAAAIAPMAEVDGMVHTNVAEPAVTFRGKDGWFFAIQPQLHDGGGTAFQWWYDSEWKKNADRAPKVALLNLDALAGHEVSKYFNALLKPMNIPIVVDMFTPNGISDTTNYVTAIKDKQADVLISLEPDALWGILVKDMKRQGVNIPIISSLNTVLASDVIRSMGPTGVGVISYLPYSMWDDTDVEGIKVIRSLYKEWSPGTEERRTVFYYGWAEEAITLEGVRIALNNVGYDGLTKDIKKGRAAMRDAMYQINGFTADGLLPPVKYSKDDRRPYTKVKVARVGEGGKIQELTGWVDAPSLTPEMKTNKWWGQQ
ncbi:MAG: ABC transporter substrate-binding protein [Chloroflexota bacterium]|nr:MAG: ABC transporter substrate-binding protein [Chloroflexota bacterium]